MAVIDTATHLYRAGNYSGSGDWLDEAGTKDLSLNGTIGFTAQSSPNLAFFTFDDAADFLTNPDAADEMKPGAGDYTLILVIRSATIDSGFPGADTQDAFGVASGIQLRETGTRVLVVIFGDGTISFSDLHPTAMSNDTIHEVGMRVDRTAEELEAFLDGTGSGTPTALTGAGLAVGGSFDIGRVSSTYLGNGDVLGLAIWVGTALSDADIATAGDELQTLIGGAVIDLAGSGANASAGSGALSLEVTLSGTGANAAAGSGAVSITRGLVGVGAAAAAGFGQLAVLRALSGAGANAGAGSGDLRVAGSTFWQTSPVGYTANPSAYMPAKPDEPPPW